MWRDGVQQGAELTGGGVLSLVWSERTRGSETNTAAVQAASKNQQSPNTSTLETTASSLKSQDIMLLSTHLRRPSFLESCGILLWSQIVRISFPVLSCLRAMALTEKVTSLLWLLWRATGIGQKSCWENKEQCTRQEVQVFHVSRVLLLTGYLLCSLGCRIRDYLFKSVYWLSDVNLNIVLVQTR